MKRYLAHLDKNDISKEQTLRSHLFGVANKAKTSGDKVGIGSMAYLVGMLHDLGKYAEEFQEYMRDEDNSHTKRSVNHSSAGAEVLWETFGGDRAGKDIKLLAEMLCYTITAHHGLYDIKTLEDQDKFAERLEKIQLSELNEEVKCWTAETGFAMQDLHRLMQEACTEYQDVFLVPFYNMKQRDDTQYKFYAGCLIRLLLSIQIDSDWADTAETMDNCCQLDVPRGEEVFPIAWDNYRRYMQHLQEKSANRIVTEKEKAILDIRNQIQTECLEFTSNGVGIYCLPIPTGAGKTLSSLGYALKYANERLEEVERIFYISPYISITEQNAQVIKEAVGNTDWVLEHHSNVVNRDDEEKDFDTAWEDRFVCTTMVQFLNTLFSDKKKSIRRFHRLKKSIVILDEVQSLPIKTIHTFNLMMNFLNRVCGTNIILCTATQPNLDSVYIKRKIWYSNQRNMISDLSRRFEQFERVKLVSHIGGKIETYESLGNQVKKTLQEVNSVLVIFNKRQPVSDFYDYMKEHMEGGKIFYLTTNLCAEHRSRRLAEIKELLRKRTEKILIISTNLIEAGVDLSVECVYRSLTGLDSIAQAAGRCNRNGELEQGTVHIFKMDEDAPSKNMDELIVAQKNTEEILFRHEKRGAKESVIFPEWMQQYFDGMYEDLYKQMNFPLKGEFQGNNIFGLLSKGFAEIEETQLLCQAFKTAGEQYQVIADTGITVLVPYGEGNGLIGDLEELTDMGLIRQCIRKLQRYTVSVYFNKKEELEQMGVIRECKVLPGIYIANGYSDEKGLENVLLDAIF